MKKAFSLVELSIVLVILGLLTGGILAGQSLIRAAELRSTTADFSRYQVAFQTFRDKYFSFPGDMRNATSFWGSAGGNGSNAGCFAALSTASTTCNGNGDGIIDTLFTNNDERFSAWKHLALSALVEGAYTGRDGAATQGDDSSPTFYRPGTNVPRGKMGNSFWELFSIPTAISPGDPDLYSTMRTGNYLLMLDMGSYPLSPEEAWNIDTKLDDGKPGSGAISTVKSSSSWAPDCSTTDSPSTAEYNLSSKDKLCYVYLNF